MEEHASAAIASAAIEGGSPALTRSLHRPLISALRQRNSTQGGVARHVAGANFNFALCGAFDQGRTTFAARVENAVGGRGDAPVGVLFALETPFDDRNR